MDVGLEMKPAVARSSTDPIRLAVTNSVGATSLNAGIIDASLRLIRPISMSRRQVRIQDDLPSELFFPSPLRNETGERDNSM